MGDEITILGIDPSTDVTGVAMLTFDHRGAGTVRAFSALEGVAGLNVSAGDALMARIARIHDTRRKLNLFLRDLPPWAIDVIAYESPFMRGYGASEAIPMATGAYLSVTYLQGLPLFPVAPATLKSVYGASIFGKTRDRKAREAKRAQLKACCVEWANQTFGLSLGTEEDAIADACAVAVAGWRLWRKAEEAKAVVPLFGPGSRPRRRKESDALTINTKGGAAGR